MVSHNFKKHHSPRLSALHCVLKGCIASAIYLTIPAYAQDALSDNLPELLKASLEGNPTLRAARLDVEASGVDVTVAERARWPEISAVMESKTGNSTNVPNRTIRLEQTLWDGHRLDLKVTEAEAQKQATFYRYGEQKQQVFLDIVAAWQSMVSSAEKMAIADHALERLDVYQAQMERRVAAKASPRIDLQLINARHNQTAVERSISQTMLRNALSRLERLTGLKRTPQNMTARKLVLPSRAGYAIGKMSKKEMANRVAQHPTVQLAQTEVQLAQARYDGKAAERWPQVYLRLEQPVGQATAYTDTHLSTFIGLRYTPGAGFANLVEAKALVARTQSAQEASVAARRQVLESFQNDRDEILSSQVRTRALENAVKGSVQVLESYRRQFQGGRKSWLDLLNAARELTQNEYALADARAALLAAYYKYRIRAQLPLEGSV